MKTYHVTRWDAMLLALACWLLATGLAMEQTIRSLWAGETVPSWTMLVGYPVLTLGIAVLLHQGFKDVTSWKTAFRGAVAILLAILTFGVTLPSSLGTSGGGKDTAVNTAKKSASDIAMLREAYKTAKRDYDQAVSLANIACKRWADSDGCKAAREQENNRARRLTELRDDLRIEGPVQEAEAAEKRIAWWWGLFGKKIDNEDIRNVTTSLPPVVLELLSAFFFVLAFGGLHPGAQASVATPKTEERREPRADATPLVPKEEVPPPVAEPEPTLEIEEEAPRTALPPPVRRGELTKLQQRRQSVVVWVANFVLQHGEAPSFAMVRSQFNLADATAAKYRAEGLMLAKKLQAASETEDE